MSAESDKSPPSCWISHILPCWTRIRHFQICWIQGACQNWHKRFAQNFKRLLKICPVTSFCGIKDEWIKHGSLDVRIWRLVKDGINQPINQKSSPSTSKINGTSNFQSWLTRLQIRFYKVSCETFRLWCNNWFMRQRAFIEIWSTREVYMARKIHKSCSRHSSGLDDAMESDNDDDTLTFGTRSGRAVQVRYFSREVS